MASGSWWSERHIISNMNVYLIMGWGVLKPVMQPLATSSRRSSKQFLQSWFNSSTKKERPKGNQVELKMKGSAQTHYNYGGFQKATSDKYPHQKRKSLAVFTCTRASELISWLSSRVPQGASSPGGGRICYLDRSHLGPFIHHGRQVWNEANTASANTPPPFWVKVTEKISFTRE